MKSIVHKSLFLFLLFFLLVPMLEGLAFNTKKVYRIPVTHTVEKGLHAFLERSFKEAKEAEAELIILDVDTPGGAVDAAKSIAKLFDTTSIKTVAYINDEGLSAGAYVSLYADEIYFSPRGRIGAAKIINSEGEALSEKINSDWIAAMKAAALSSKREPLYAMAMADETIDLPKYSAPKGKLLTLTAEDAREVGYSEGTVESFEALVEQLGYAVNDVQQTEETFSEQLARFITNPIVIPILLSLAGIGLVVELYSPGFGFAGSAGITALLLFFYGHLIAGFAGYETIILFIVGVGLLVTELFVSGGIAGVIGLIAVFTSIILAGANPYSMMFALLIAVAVVAVWVVIIIKFFGKKLHLLNKMVLTDSTDTESGYVSNINRTELLGQTGVALTPLRPAGTAEVNGERLDVVSEGGYLEKDSIIQVIKVEGSRIVVREIKESEGITHDS